jgi:hypothetical protein
MADGVQATPEAISADAFANARLLPTISATAPVNVSETIFSPKNCVSLNRELKAGIDW